MYILGIETSCDETGAAVIHADSIDKPVALLSNIIATSLALHAETGGIIPEVAAREQIRYILPVIDEALREANVTIEKIDAIAVTYGPGLIGSLLIGVETAKTLSLIYKKSLIPVNHLYGHIYANWIVQSEGKIEQSSAVIVFPALALVVSGGHTDLVLMQDHGDLKLIGGTRDDAAGEAFDKIGRLLGMPYPAGPLISKLAEAGNPKAFVLPRPMIGSGDFDFSFSGLKTSVLNLVKKNDWENLYASDGGSQVLADLCASVDEAIIDIITRKTIKAALKFEVKSIILGGGVAASSKLQERVKLSALRAMPSAGFFAPPRNLCTDNAAMIAAAGFYNQNITSWENLTANPELYF